MLQMYQIFERHVFVFFFVYKNICKENKKNNSLDLKNKHRIIHKILCVILEINIFWGKYIKERFHEQKEDISHLFYYNKGFIACLEVLYKREKIDIFIIFHASIFIKVNNFVKVWKIYLLVTLLLLVAQIYSYENSQICFKRNYKVMQRNMKFYTVKKCSLLKIENNSS